MIKPEKKFDTGLRILEVLKILLAKDVSKKELIEKIRNNSEFENVYTQEAFIKYFNTFNLAGLKINKDKNVYKLSNAIYSVSLSEDEIKVLFKFIRYIKRIHNKQLEKTIGEIIYTFAKYTEEQLHNEINSVLKEKVQSIKQSPNIINSLESLLYDNQLIVITYYKNKSVKDTITVELKEIIEKDNTVLISCYDPVKSRNKKIYIDSITEIKQSPKKSTGIKHLDSVIFCLYGRLANSYKLKESEKVIDFGSDYLIVSNTEEDKDYLLRRLLKYGENCKITYPKSIQKEFLSLTDEILKNLEEGIK